MKINIKGNSLFSTLLFAQKIEKWKEHYPKTVYDNRT